MDVKYQIFVSSTYADLVDDARMGRGHVPTLQWQAGVFIPIHEMLSIGLVPERLCACPVLYREIRIGGEELPCFLPGLFHMP
ncbi:hypothetical protein NKI59_33185 [Mesorhizobium sp. M0598]|uniref:hypothetical protein n=1 Tax=unclassified Mesorhizobium TaxID=325217 RepID=UPI00333B728C